MKLPIVLSQVTLLFIVASGVAKAQTNGCSPNARHAEWSTNAVDISPSRSNGKQNLRICSPDRKKSVVVKGENWWAEVGDKRISKSSQLDLHAQLGWAPDSGAFYITESMGFTTGSHTEIYLFHDRRLRFLNPNRIIMKDFERHHKCWDERFDVGNLPNVGGLTWPDADHLLLIAEVPNLGICQQMMYFGGYLFSIDDRQVIERYSPEQLRQRWRNVIGHDWRVISNI